jgi:heptose I phosphotransferase
VKRREAIVPAWRARLAAVGLDSLAAMLKSDVAPPGRWETLSKPGLGGRERCRWTLGDGNEDAVIIVKRYRRTPIAEQLDRIHRQTRRHSRAWWECRQAERLAAARIAVPAAVGFAEEMRGALERCSVVLLGCVPGDAFERVWARLCDDAAPCTRGRARHEITASLAEFIAAFHRTGCCHRDLYLCHVFTDLDRQARRPPAFWLIDLARTHHPRWRRARWLVKDLSQLDCSARQIGATRTDRLRFLRAYLGGRPRDARTRRLARRVRRKSDRILRRIERKSGLA